MEKAIEIIEREIKATDRTIEYHLESGNPSIELIRPSPFRKKQDLLLALSIVNRYNTKFKKL